MNKEKLCEAPISQRSDPNARLTVVCDACNTGSGKQGLITWASRAITGDERKLNTSEKEFPTIEWACGILWNMTSKSRTEEACKT